MTGSRRPATRRTASVEPSIEPVARQTRSSAKRIGQSVEPDIRPSAEIPHRGTQRQSRSRKSGESVATTGFPKGSADDASPNPERATQAPVPEPINRENTPESPETKAAKLQDLLDYDMPKFLRWTGKMYDILASIGDSRPGAADLSRLNSTGVSYTNARRVFVDDAGLFIDSARSEKYDIEIRATVQTAVCSGNIVSLLTSILDVERAKKEALPILEQLDKTFPALFDPDLESVTEDTERTLDLAFLIRWRRLVDSLVAKSTVNPYILAANIFCDQPVASAKKAEQALRKGPHRQLAGINIDEVANFHTTYQAHIHNELLPKLSSDNRSELHSLLDQIYPQEQLFHSLRSWGLELFQRINMPKSRRHSQSANQTEQTNVQTAEEASESLFVGDEARDDSGSDSDTDTEEYAQLPPQGANQNFIDGPAALAAARQSEKRTSEVATTPPSQQQISKGKGKEQEPAIIDKIRHLEPGQVLNNPHRHSPISSSPRSTRGPVPTFQPDVAANQAAAQKRSRMDDSSDHEEDFELNEQPVDESRRIRYEDADSRGPSPKRPRSTVPPSAGQSRALTSVAGSPQGAVAERISRDVPPDGNLQQQDLITLSQHAQANRRAHNWNKPRQVRKEWSAADTSRLLDLIADPSLNCSWSAMERTDGFEMARSQQSLRDKARSLKVWYLQGDNILPAGFDQVVLGRKEKDAVISTGRNPDRTEDDIDEDGEIINNIWAD
ncbi:hypothetical protein F5B20DRAFT_159183 [Whalleya microplaca]|nr:hypothetical protein F5B20DRAFT_159183 [Whalleya microplaca]